MSELHRSIYTHNFLGESRWKGTYYWTNGDVEKRAKECPGDGFVKGRGPKFWSRRSKSE